MREFTSIRAVSLSDLLQVLEAWELGQVAYWQVQDWAERISEGEEWPTFNIDDPKSAVANVIDLLDLMYVEHLLRQDIPALRAYLHTYLISPEKASQDLDAHWSRIELDERRKIPQE